MTKPDGELKKFLDAKKPSSRLIGDIERHLMQRPAEKRDYTVIHPSDMAKPTWCHREQYFLLMGHERKAEKANLRLQSIFDEGHSIHHKWQNWFKEMNNLYGLWHCEGCGIKEWGLPSHFMDDPNCGPLHYKEVPLWDKALRIRGHADGWIKGIGDDCLIEIKSIGAGTIRMEAPHLMDGDLTQAWRGIRRPFRSHLMQGNIYLELLKRMHEAGDIESHPNEIVFLYELKADQSYKEFVVKPSYDMVSDLFDAAESIVAATSLGVPPSCNINVQSGCKSCKPYEEES